jgi:hypothetical protein
VEILDIPPSEDANVYPKLEEFFSGRFQGNYLNSHAARQGKGFIFGKEQFLCSRAT